MNHLGTQSLETKRLILRPFTEADAPAMFRNWASDPLVTEYLIWPAYTAESDVADYLRSVVKQYERADCYEWAIVLKELGEPVGSIGVVNLRVQSVPYKHWSEKPPVLLSMHCRKFHRRCFFLPVLPASF